MYFYYLTSFGEAYTDPAVNLLCYQTPEALRSVPSCPVHLPTNRSNSPL